MSLLERFVRKKKKKAGNNSRDYVEGWVEFRDKRVAKLVAASLNSTPMGTRKRSRFHDDLWNMKVRWGMSFFLLTIRLLFCDPHPVAFPVSSQIQVGPPERTAGHREADAEAEDAYGGVTGEERDRLLHAERGPQQNVRQSGEEGGRAGEQH